jgi:type II secretory pathway component GspD/PulD (secretin)
MTPHISEPPERARRYAAAITSTLLLLTSLTVLFATHAYGQSKTTKLADLTSANEKPVSLTYKTFYLNNLTAPHDANEIQNDLRNMLPNAKLFYVPSQSAISVRGSADDIALAQKILTDLDRTRKVYRLTYTITETGDGQPAGKQQVALVVASGGKSDLKQGSKVPIVIGVYPQTNEAEQSNVQYQDIGLEIESTLDNYAEGARLRTRIAQSAVAEEKSGIGVQDPVFRQSTLDSTAILVPGKPLILGSLDLPGTNRRQQVEVVAETIP